MRVGSSEPGGAVSRVLADIAAERAREDRKWGKQHYPAVPMPTAPTRAPRLPVHLAVWVAHVLGVPTREVAQIACKRAAAAGEKTWGHILVEELAEAIEVAACGSSAELRAELVQVAAVCAAWMEDIDRLEVPELDPRDATRADESVQSTARRVYLCSVCREVAVDAENGFDTCQSCLRSV